MKNMEKEIIFNVKDYFNDKLKSSAKALGFVNALMQVNMTEDDFNKKVYDKCLEETESTLHRAIKNIKEINETEKIITKINNMLQDLGSNLRLRQYTFITKDVNIRNKVYLIGNGYFRWIFQITDIQLPDKDFYQWEMEDDFKSSLRKGFLTITEENENIEISLTENIDDEIDYDKSYLEVVSQVLMKSKVESRHEFVGAIYIESEDKKVYADMDTDDMCDVFLLAHGQTRTDRWDNRFEISIDELNSILEQLES